MATVPLIVGSPPFRRGVGGGDPDELIALNGAHPHAPHAYACRVGRCMP
jgi:hypothetical protein